MSDEELLYHYTTVEALASIVKHGELWASHILHLNDTSEQRILWKLIGPSVEAQIRTKPTDYPKLEHLKELQRLAESPIDQDIYVISFSQDGGDRLSQWRGYGSAGGVAMGFNIAALRARCSSSVWLGQVSSEQVPPPPRALALLTKVQYVDPQGDDATGKIIFVLTKDPLTLGESKSNLSREQIFSRRVGFMAARLKHSAFHEEAEWRIVIFDHRQELATRFQCRKSMMVPYVPFDLGDEVWPLISRVVVGPSPHQKETIAAIKKMLGDKVEVVGSKIPYRDW